MRWQTKLWIAGLSRAALVRVLCAAFLLATVVELLLGIGVQFAVLLSSVAAVLVLLGIFRAVNQWVLTVAAVCAICSLAIVRVVLLPETQAPFAAYFEQSVSLVGRVAQDPKEGATNTQVIVRVESIDKTPVSGRALLFVGVGERVQYLDYVTATGRLSAPESFETETGARFDYAGYLAAKGIGATMFQPRITAVQPPECCSLLGSLYAFKQRLMRSIQEAFPEPQGGLLQGMLLGEQNSLPEQIIETFRRSSLVHVVVLSGYNLTIIAIALMWLLGRVSSMSRNTKLLVAGVGIVLFAAMVGFSATVARAAIMASIALGAQVLQRPGAALHALIIAATVMAAANPRIVTDDPSFILSFLATFGLVTLSPMLVDALTRVGAYGGLREIAAATLSTQVFVLPALIFYTGQASMVALPANIAALPLVPPAMFLGASAALAGLVSSVLASLLMLPASALLWAIVEIAQIAAMPSFASVDVSVLQSPNIFWVYVVLIPLALWSAHAYTTEHGDTKRMPIL